MLVAAYHVIRMFCTSPLWSDQTSKTLIETFLDQTFDVVILDLNAYSSNLVHHSDASVANLVCIASFSTPEMHVCA